jgi:hypothetical protein
MNNIDGTTLRIWVKLGYPGRVSSSSGNGQSSEKVVFEEKGAQRAYGQCKHILTHFWDRRCLAVNQFINEDFNMFVMNLCVSSLLVNNARLSSWLVSRKSREDTHRHGISFYLRYIIYVCPRFLVWSRRCYSFLSFCFNLIMYIMRCSLPYNFSCRGRDRIVDRFKTTYAIISYHH